MHENISRLFSQIRRSHALFWYVSHRVPFQRHRRCTRLPLPADHARCRSLCRTEWSIKKLSTAKEVDCSLLVSFVHLAWIIQRSPSGLENKRQTEFLFTGLWAFHLIYFPLKILKLSFGEITSPLTRDLLIFFSSLTCSHTSMIQK